MNRLKRLVDEIHRRSLWQVVGIYAGGSWLAFEVSQTLTEGLGLPDWVPPLALVLLVVGLPVVIATAFVQEGIGPQARGEPAVGAVAVDRPTEGPASISDEVLEPSAAPPAHHRVLTWRNALLGIFGAFALLGLGTGGYMAMRTLGIGPAGTLIAKGALQERDILVLADFTGPDSSLTRTVTEALRIDLAQSQIVTLLPAGDLREVLGRMQRDPNEPLVLDVAREVAIREGFKGVIGGVVNRAGTGFVLSIQLVTPAEGEALVSVRETAGDNNEVISAVDRLSKRLRERIGEPLRSVRASPGLARRTTSSLEALQRLSEGIRVEMRGDYGMALALYEEATRLDTAFAYAYRKIGIALTARREDRARAVHAFTRALELRSGLPEYERLIIEGTFHAYVTGDLEQAVLVEERISEIIRSPINNLGVAHRNLGDYVQAEAVFQALVARRREAPLFHSNLAEVQIGLGKFDEAAATLERLAEIAPDYFYLYQDRAELAAARGEYETATEALTALKARRGRRVLGSRGLAYVGAIQGRLDEAEAQLAVALAIHERRGRAGDYLADVVRLAALDLVVEGDRAGALARVGDALRSYPLDSLSAHDRPYEALAWLYAAAKRPDEARTLLAAYEDEVRPKNWEREVYRLRAQAQIALSEEDPRAAIGVLESMEGIPNVACQPICTLTILGQAYEMLAEPDSAVAIYERYVATPRWDKIQWDALYLPQLYERLAQLYDERGDLESAARYYAMFVELWAEADDELQPRVQAAQARLEEIVAERG